MGALAPYVSSPVDFANTFLPMPKRAVTSGTPTLSDLARIARVSKMTVSRALRSPEKVTEQTRLRIAAAIEELSYVPNQIAGSLSSNRTNVAAAIVPSIRNSLFSSMLQGMADRLGSRGYSLMVGEAGYSLEAEERMIESFLAQRPCGLLLHGTSHTARAIRLLERAGIPIVETGNMIRRPLDSVVSFSNFLAGKAMTSHLIERGYQRIAFVSLLIDSNERSRERRRGYIAALRKAGREPEGDVMMDAAGGFEAGAKVLSELMERRPRIDAVFFCGDVLAIGALFECQRRGWRVPERIAIAGFDDFEMATQVVPALTTLAIPRREIGAIAGRIILDRIDTVSDGSERVDVGFSVEQRAST